jgi:Zn-dependent protease with chaperone function
MALTQEQFDALVLKLEHEAERNPAGYKLKLGAFACLGYLYVLGVLAVLIVASGGLIAALFVSRGLILLVKKLLIPLVVLIGVVAKSLWVKLDAPQGLELKRSEHSTLFDAIDSVRRVAKAPRAHTVLLTNDFNAAIVQVPRLGMFGWQKNFLILGLPLLQLLSPAELKAVLAHEFGHLSGAHGRFGAWIYRIRLGWARLAQALNQENHWGSFMFVPFFNWFAPRFAAYSFVQARRQELDADRLAAETVGAREIASALVRLDLKSEDLNKSYWPAIYANADEHPTPAALPYRGLLGTGPRDFLAQAPQQLEQALKRETSTADTHPCLRERVAALSLAADVPQPIEESAAAALLGDRLASLVEHFDQQWQTTVGPWWRTRHEHVKASRRRLETLESKPLAELDDDELFEYAQLVEEIRGQADAFALYEALVSRGAKHLGAKFAYGRLLLARNDESGIRVLEQVMSESASAVLPGCEIIVLWLRENGRAQEAQPYVDRYLQQQEREDAERRQRAQIFANDTWLPAELKAESLAAIQQALKDRPNIKAAWLVQKKMADGARPLHVLGVLRKSQMLKFEKSGADQRLISELANSVLIAEELLFIALGGENKAFKKRFKKVAGARVR